MNDFLKTNPNENERRAGTAEENVSATASSSSPRAVSHNRFFALTFSALLCLAVFFTVFLCGCDLIRVPKTLAVTGGGSSRVCAVGEFDLSTVTLTVTYSDGSSEEVTLNESMLPATELAKLYKPGEQTLRVEYEGLATELKVYITRRTFPDTVKFEDLRFEFDGKSHAVSVTGDLPAGSEVFYPDGNTVTDAGEYDLTAIVRCDGYDTITLNATVTVDRATFDLGDLTVSDASFLYDGAPKQVYAENVPKEVFVKYSFTDAAGKTVSAPTDAGVYTEILSFECLDAANYLPIEDRRVTVEVLPAVYDLGGAEMHSQVFTYDGTEKNITVDLPNGLPENVRLSYAVYTGGTLDARNYRTVSVDGLTKVGHVTDAGLYLVVATFTGDDKNYEKISDMRALLTVNKQVIDLSGFAPASDFLPYDGEEHSVKLVGDVPDGVKVAVTYNGVATESVRRAGNYEVVFTFTPSDEKNYDVSEKTKKTALIIETVIETVDFSAEDIFFDPDAGASEPKYRLENVPEGMSISLVFSDDDGKAVSPETMVRGGVYNFTATFTYDDEDRQASTVIVPLSDRVRLREKLVLTEEIRFPGLSVYYDGNEHTVELEGTYPDDLVTYTDNVKTDAGKYTAIATLNTAEYYVLTPSGPASDDYRTVLLINQIFVNLSHLTFEPLTVSYDGAEHSVAVAGELPEWVTVSYTNAKATNAGVYEAKAVFVYDEKNVIVNVDKLETLLTIEKTLIDLTGITFPELTVTYDREPHTVEISGTLPSNVYVSVDYNGTNTKTDAGTYTARATFVYDRQNYFVHEEYLETTLKINKASIDLSAFGFDLTPQRFDYDGTKHNFYLDTSKVPDYLRVMSGSGNAEVGRYEETVLITNPNYYNVSFRVLYYVDFTSANIRASRFSMYNSETHLNDIGYRAEYIGVDNASYMTATVNLCFLSFYDEEGVSTPKDNLAVNTTYTWTVNLYYMNGDTAFFTGTITTLD